MTHTHHVGRRQERSGAQDLQDRAARARRSVVRGPALLASELFSEGLTAEQLALEAEWAELGMDESGPWMPGVMAARLSGDTLQVVLTPEAQARQRADEANWTAFKAAVWAYPADGETGICHRAVRRTVEEDENEDVQFVLALPPSSPRSSRRHQA